MTKLTTRERNRINALDILRRRLHCWRTCDTAQPMTCAEVADLWVLERWYQRRLRKMDVKVPVCDICGAIHA